jgi:hypothetical protein
VYAAGIPDDWATPQQRERMAFLESQLHALGLARAQARARGDAATDRQLGALVTKLETERRALQAAIIAQGNKGNAAVESGAYDTPLEKIARGIRSAAIIGGLALGALVILPPLLRNRGGSRRG